jgi:hypothetical protein
VVFVGECRWACSDTSAKPVRSRVDRAEKEVDYVENKPFQFKVNVVNGGRQVDIEVRLKVLSSQHEDMFFVVKFMALDPLTKREVSPYLVVHSLPIKVISVRAPPSRLPFPYTNRD